MRESELTKQTERGKKWGHSRSGNNQSSGTNVRGNQSGPVGCCWNELTGGIWCEMGLENIQGQVMKDLSLPG